VSPVACRAGPFLMGHQRVVGARLERREIAPTAFCAHGVLPHPPAACDRGERGATRGRQAVETQWAVGVGEGRSELRRLREPAAVDAPHHRGAGCAADRQPWMAIWTHRLGLTGRHALLEACGGTRLERPQAPPHATRAPAPGARAAPSALGGPPRVAQFIAVRSA
jgi:hypothetical protein